MTDYLLDTCVIKYWYNQGCSEHAKVSARIQAIRSVDPQMHYVPKLFVSAVTIGEIEYGHRVTLTPMASTQAEYRKFVSQQCPEPLEITKHVGEHYGALRAWLFNTYSDKKKRTKAQRPEELVFPTSARDLGVQENDIWIAAQAITHNLVLVTHDSRGHFGELLHQFHTALRVQDWAQ